MRSRTSFAILALAVLAACRQPRTEILVWVDSDMAYGADAELRTIKIVVRSGAPQGPIRLSHELTLSRNGGSVAGARAYPLPLSFGVGALDGSGTSPVWIEIAGYDAGGNSDADASTSTRPLVEQRALLRFGAGRTCDYHVHLTARCRHVECAQGDTCDPVAGYCVRATEQRACDADAGNDDASATADGSVAGLVENVAAGDGYTCALMLDHTVRCWGRVPGRPGALRSVRNQPMRIDGLDDVAQISVGRAHACARIRSSGTVRCWGSNRFGQLGNNAPGSAFDSADPVTVVVQNDLGQDQPLDRVVDLGSGAAHGCALRDDGTAWCWGHNNSGQLGNRAQYVGALAPDVPVAAAVQDPDPSVGAFRGLATLSVGANRVCGLLSNGETRCWGAAIGLSPTDLFNGAHALAIASGGFHSCLLTEGGRVRCSGGNTFGQLGVPDNSATGQDTGLNGALEVSAGLFHTCARMSDGTARCWGRNDVGQLGNGTRDGTTMPVSVLGLRAVTHLSAGVDHTCAVSSDHNLHCWGGDLWGELGSGRELASARPVNVVSGVTPLEVTASAGQVCASENSDGRCWGLLATGRQPFAPAGIERLRLVDPPTAQIGFWNSIDRASTTIHSCLVLHDGTVQCWGLNLFGELGDGSFISRVTPAIVRGLENVAEVSTGAYHTCALLRDRTVRCWGANGDGQLGDSSFQHQPTPVAVNLTDVRQVVAAARSTCALLGDGTVRCWGGNDRGQLGRGSMGNPSAFPLPASGVVNATQLSARDAHACARISDGSVMCWGFNGSGQLGRSMFQMITTPTRVENLPSALEVHAGWDSTCARVVDQSVWCMGANWTGQLGDGTSIGRATPMPVIGLGPVAELSVGRSHACARRADGSISCWGGNVAGQLGIGNRESSPLPMRVRSITASSLAAGDSQTCALNTAGALQCWGDNTTGALGTTTPTRADAAVRVSLPGPTSSISAGAWATCVLETAGTARCWGANPYGILGGGNNAETSAPVVVVGLPANVVEIANGSFHGCVRTAGGAVWCWGNNQFGQLGDGTTVNRVEPAPVPGITNAVSLSVNGLANCAALADHTARCWGLNASGQLGNGTQNTTPNPTPLRYGATATAPDGITDVASIRVGDGHSCVVLTGSGEVRCAGWNGNGEIGVPAIQAVLAPTAVSDPSGTPGSRLNGVSEVAIGGRHTCALLTSGRVACWGANEYGQLGSRFAAGGIPHFVAALPASSNVQSIATGLDNSCARTDGPGGPRLTCWGAGMGPVFANGQRANVDSPFEQEGFAGITALAMGGAHTCGLFPDGARCFGNNLAGQLGSRADSETTPVSTAAVTRVEELGIGMNHRCGRLSGTVRCRGANFFGQLGDRLEDRLAPVEIAGVHRAQSLAVGRDHNCAVVAALEPLDPLGSSVLCWGRNDLFQLGNSAQQPGDVVPVPGFRRAAALAAGAFHTCARKTDGTVWCWGANDRGQLGDGTRTGTGTGIPSRVALDPNSSDALTDVAQVVAGGAYTCARQNSGTIWCWGANARGQLGNGNAMDATVPQRVVGITDAVNIAAGRDDHCERDEDGVNQCDAVTDEHTCAIRANGEVWCWGRNDRGQLGNGTFDDSTIPARVDEVDGFAAERISLGGLHSCVVTSPRSPTEAGELHCWGDNRYGQLIRPEPAARNEPVLVQLPP